MICTSLQSRRRNDEQPVLMEGTVSGGDDRDGEIHKVYGEWWTIIHRVLRYFVRFSRIRSFPRPTRSIVSWSIRHGSLISDFTALPNKSDVSRRSGSSVSVTGISEVIRVYATSTSVQCGLWYHPCRDSVFSCRCSLCSNGTDDTT